MKTYATLVKRLAALGLFPALLCPSGPLFAAEGLEPLVPDNQLIPASEQDAEAEQDAEGEQNTSDDDLAFGLGWLDSTQAFASHRVNALANEVDRFFGVPRSDLEAAYSSLRVTWINSWMEMEGYDTDLRVRGKVHLPRINERISLIFSEDEGEGTSYYDQGDSATQRSRSTKLNLELNVRDNENHRLDFRVGLRSSLKARASARYRYQRPFLENFAHRFTQTAYFRDGDGFGSISRYQVERLMGENALLRWTNDVRFEESFHGAEWGSGITYYQRHSEEAGISYYARIHGETRPDFITAQDIGVRLRRNVLRPWLFVELEPGYTWQKETVDAPREGSPFIFVRFEMAIGRLDE